MTTDYETEPARLSPYLGLFTLVYPALIVASLGIMYAMDARSPSFSLDAALTLFAAWLATQHFARRENRYPSALEVRLLSLGFIGIKSLLVAVVMVLVGIPLISVILPTLIVAAIQWIFIYLMLQKTGRYFYRKRHPTTMPANELQPDQ